MKPKKYHDYKSWSLVTSLYSHDINLVYFNGLLNRLTDYKKKIFCHYRDWSQSKDKHEINDKKEQISSIVIDVFKMKFNLKP